MSTSEKLTYLNGTKQALKESINNLGGDITNETTFREYAQELDNIYDNLPKTTGESSNLSLTTLKGKMNTTLKGDTSQDGTPTPDTPIDIEVVTGTQEVKVENKNLLDYTKFETSRTAGGVTFTNNNDGTIKLNGTSTSELGYYLIPSPTYYTENEFGTYTYKCYGLPSTCKTDIYYSGQPTGETIASYNINVENRNYAMRIVIPSGITLNNVVIKPMLVKGNYTSDTFPSYVEHQEQTYPISLGNIKLVKMPNTSYKDYLFKNLTNGKWYKKECIYNISNKTNWSVNNVTSNNRAVVSLSGNGFPYSSDIGYTNANAISNCFTGIAQANQASTTEINNIAINNANMYIKFADTINTKALVKEQLDSMTNLEIYYAVATPTDIEITDTTLIEQLEKLEKMKSYNGVTNINCSGNLSAILSVSAIKGES